MNWARTSFMLPAQVRLNGRVGILLHAAIVWVIWSETRKLYNMLPLFLPVVYITYLVYNGLPACDKPLGVLWMKMASANAVTMLPF